LARNAAISGATHRVGRRADRRAGSDQLLVGPGLGAVRIDPDREVAVESERQPGLASGLGRGAELAVGFPLQPLEEVDPIGVRASKFGDLRRMRMAHRRRPGMPREAGARAHEMLVQCLEYREIGERPATRQLKFAKRQPERALRLASLKPPEQRFEHRPLQRRDRGVIDQLAIARRGDRRRCCHRLRRSVFGEARDRGHIDVEKIEPGAARW
jgi:hypothetical protein